MDDPPYIYLLKVIPSALLHLQRECGRVGHNSFCFWVHSSRYCTQFYIYCIILRQEIFTIAHLRKDIMSPFRCSIYRDVQSRSKGMPFWRAQTFLMQMDFLPITGLQNILQSAPFMLFLVYYPKVSECNAKNVLIEMQIRFLKFAIKSRTFLPLVEPQTIARGEIFLIATFSTLKKMKIRFARCRLA